MSYLKEILLELCPHVHAEPSNLPSWWNDDTIKRLGLEASQANLIQRSKSGVRNDELPLDDEAYAASVDDYGDIRDGDAGQSGHGMDAYSDGEENIEYEEPSLRSVVRSIRAEEEEQEDELDNPRLETDPDEVTTDEVDDDYGEENMDDEFADEAEPQEPQEWDDPNYQGVIRRVPKAHLVYKRQQEDGTFDELWQYSIGDDFKSELKTRRAIIAGTDIPPNKMSSPDNTQSYTLWTAGNAQILHIRGIPN